ncbi:MAG: hypothetical protein NC043_04735 [Muribaculaceae bacterium]|nr:hypothetical protein [Muribaculaceae bacterium]
MLQEVTKGFVISALIGAACLVGGCSESSRQAGERRVAEAREKYEAGDYSGALAIIGEIDSLYRGELDVRRAAMHLKPQILEQLALRELTENDSLIAVTSWLADSLSRDMRFVSNSIEGYYVSRTEPADINGRPGLYARMSPDGQFYMVAVNAPGARSNAISVTVAGESASSATLPSDGERVDRSGRSEVLTFMQIECDSVGSLISRHSGEPASLTFLGGKPTTVSLTPDQTRAIAQVYTAAQAFTDMKLLQVRKARLEKTLTVARNQTARTMNDTTQSAAQ